MSDENGTETTRSDVPDAVESPFGDAPDDGAAATVEEEDSNAAVAEEQDSDSESAQDGRGSDDGEEQDAGDKAEASEDLKVVVSIRDGRAIIGVQRPSADPHIETFDNRDISGLAQEVMAVTERAMARWEEAPKHPAYERPAPSARRRNRRQRREAQDTNARTEAAEAQQQTLRLF